MGVWQGSMTKTTRVLFSVAALMIATCSPVARAEPPKQPRTALKVCADPFSLPASNKEHQGFENKIAELFANDLGLPVEYTWFPQRIGFIRNTLKNNDTDDGSYKCDIVMGVTEHFELAANSRPYYHSTWALVYVKGRGFDDIKSSDDLLNLPPERKKQLRIGLFDQSPAALWLNKHDMMDYMIPYQIMTGDAKAYPGQIIEQDLVNDKINLTFVWGPIAGYFAKQIKDHEVVVIPMKSESDIRFDFRIVMAVRFGEKEWKQQVNDLIDRHRDEIHQILVDYGVPLIEDPVEDTAEKGTADGGGDDKDKKDRGEGGKDKGAGKDEPPDQNKANDKK